MTSWPDRTHTDSGDPFGIRPRYFHPTTGCFGTSLHDFVPARPAIDSVVEYVAFGEVWRSQRTFLDDVVRLPPGATVQNGVVVAGEAYPEIALSMAPPYALVERFWEIFRGAVWRSIAGASEIVVSLSGGLDSAAMAAAAVELVGTGRVRAMTMGFERDYEDLEPRFARQTAEFLGIPWDFVPADSTPLFVDWPHTDIWPTEPTTGSRASWDALLPDGSVILWGLGADSLLRGDRAHYQRRIARGEWREAFGDAWQAVVLRGKRPGLGLRAMLHRPGVVDRPDWLRARAPGFESAAALRQVTYRRGVDELLAPAWGYYFEMEAPENTGRRHRYVSPFFDVELVDFMASLPTAPWCIDKEILRSTLRGRIPESVRTRPKSPVLGEPLVELSSEGASACRAALLGGGADELIVTKSLIEALTPGIHEWSAMAPIMRCCAAARWLDRLTP